jgi:hypothetical protein
MILTTGNVVAAEVDGYAIVKLTRTGGIDYIYEVHVVRDLADQRLRALHELNDGAVKFDIRKTKVYVTA